MTSCQRLRVACGQSSTSNSSWFTFWGIKLDCSVECKMTITSIDLSLRRLLTVPVLTLIALLAGLSLLILSSEPSNNKVISGGCDDSFSPFFFAHFNDGRKITYCENGDQDVRTLFSDYVSVNDSLHIQYSGYPQTQGISLYIESENGIREKFELDNAGEKWIERRVNIPDNLDPELRLRVNAVDESRAVFGWVGIASVRPDTSSTSVMVLGKIIFYLLFFHLVFSLFLSSAMRFHAKESAIVSFVTGVGLVGWLAFWAYLGSRWVGLFLSLLVVAGVLLQVYFHFRDSTWRNLWAANCLLLPSTSLALYILVLGYYPFPPSDSVDWGVAANRWMSLPIDNWIPRILAMQIWQGSVSSPMLGDWLSSDRPPLQTGIYLLFYALGKGDSYQYQVLSTLLQTMVLLPVLLLARQISPIRFPPLLLAGLGVSSMLVVHSLFVWPKLLSATYVLITCFLLVTQFERSKDLNPRNLQLAGACAAFAMLSHGGAVFSLLAIGVVYVFLLLREMIANKLIPSLKNVYLPIASSVAIYLPWVGYQALYDPPGNRLMKWHIAGVIEPDSMSTVEAVRAAYRELSLSEWWAGRLDNIQMILSGSLQFFYDAVAYVKSVFVEGEVNVEKVIASSFFETAYSFWFFSPLLIVVLGFITGFFKRESALSVPVHRLWITSLLSYVFWALLMYLPGSTITHQGSFFQWVALYIVLAAAAWRISYRFFFMLLIANIVFSLSLYSGLTQEIGVFSMVCFVLFLVFLGCCFTSAQSFSREVLINVQAMTLRRNRSFN